MTDFNQDLIKVVFFRGLFHKLATVIIILLYKYLDHSMKIKEITILMELKFNKQKETYSKKQGAKFSNLFEKIDVGLVLIKNNMIEF
jgi:hypothetical protein